MKTHGLKIFTVFLFIFVFVNQFVYAKDFEIGKPPYWNPNIIEYEFPSNCQLTDKSLLVLSDICYSGQLNKYYDETPELRYLYTMQLGNGESFSARLFFNPKCQHDPYFQVQNLGEWSLEINDHWVRTAVKQGIPFACPQGALGDLETIPFAWLINPPTPSALVREQATIAFSCLKDPSEYPYIYGRTKVYARTSKGSCDLFLPCTRVEGGVPLCKDSKTRIPSFYEISRKNCNRPGLGMSFGPPGLLHNKYTSACGSALINPNCPFDEGEYAFFSTELYEKGVGCDRDTAELFGAGTGLFLGYAKRDLACRTLTGLSIKEFAKLSACTIGADAVAIPALAITPFACAYQVYDSASTTAYEMGQKRYYSDQDALKISSIWRGRWFSNFSISDKCEGNCTQSCKQKVQDADKELIPGTLTTQFEKIIGYYIRNIMEERNKSGTPREWKDGVWSFEETANDRSAVQQAIDRFCSE